MIRIVQSPSIIEASGNIPKQIEEYFGHANTRQEDLSIARMVSPPGWKEPGQQPRFDEYTIVLDGTLRVETRKDDFFVHAGQAIMVGRGEWVRYSSPEPEGAAYIAVCIPAFSPETVHRDPE